MPPSLRDWLAEDHLAWFVIDAVGRLDLSVFYAAYRADGLLTGAVQDRVGQLMGAPAAVTEIGEREVEERRRLDDLHGLLVNK